MKTGKPYKNKGALEHVSCSGYPNCEDDLNGCLLQLMRKDKAVGLANKPDQPWKNKGNPNA